MRAKKGCIGRKTNRWITSWHVVWFLISRWQPTVFWPMGDDDFLRWTSGAFFYKRESIFWAESICPPPAFVPLWVINENEEAIRSEEPLISLDLLWIRNLWGCVIYITLVTCSSHNFLHKEIPSHISYGGLQCYDFPESLRQFVCSLIKSKPLIQLSVSKLSNCKRNHTKTAKEKNKGTLHTLMMTRLKLLPPKGQ